MIRRAFLVFLILTIGYALFVEFVKVDRDTSQHQASGNRIKAEQFVFGTDDPDATVIVGSSLSFRIILDSLPAGTSNLGFGGLSIYDGLELIRRSGKHPARVLIETNMLFKEPDHSFLDAVFAPGLYALRREIPILQEENQPTGVLVGWLKEQLRTVPDASATGTDSMAMSQTLFDTNMASFAVVPPDSVQDRYLDLLATEVAALEAQHIEVIFMEVPVSPEITASPLAMRSRAMIEARFPDHRFLRTDPNITWRTADGLHLEPHNAQRFSSWLAKALR
ncbi:MAG: hypothetical protein IPH05_01295 [Flavobacteriales bacterium]|jgi:hypothetical protein|nr:hypothetical protein [Flavobacteriales bacterium]MBK6550254.1 hypothetical protein [Flavobacteriales bacterium]MBK6881582.1 hypothetical protein [Flavobacteriales bacterium]MBK7102898.1 hypothetical protein [Flavobacteriales bacterium]MBK7113497.1 hypothetical protein [Flavobacteriales bacterium]